MWSQGHRPEVNRALMAVDLGVKGRDKGSLTTVTATKYMYHKNKLSGFP